VQMGERAHDEVCLRPARSETIQTRDRQPGITPRVEMATAKEAL
jgi:hypothetical protein